MCVGTYKIKLKFVNLFIAAHLSRVGEDWLIVKARKSFKALLTRECFKISVSR